jgi:hypothetical protein
MSKRYGWAQLTEEQIDKITRAKADFVAERSRKAPAKQMWSFAEWLVNKLARVLK